MSLLAVLAGPPTISWIPSVNTHEQYMRRDIRGKVSEGLRKLYAARFTVFDTALCAIHITGSTQK